jgi:hypothetical protein
MFQEKLFYLNIKIIILDKSTMNLDWAEADLPIVEEF